MQGFKTKTKVPRKIAQNLSILIPAVALLLFAFNWQRPEANTGKVLGASTEAILPDQSQDFNFSTPLQGPIIAVPRGEEADNTEAVKQTNYSVVPDVKAKSFLVYDPAIETILYQKNIDEQVAIASLTKLMTAIVASEDPGFKEAITVTQEDVLRVSPYLSLVPGDKVGPEDLVKAMLLGSANDAALTLANHFPNKTDFVSKMNAKAKELQMTKTHFSNPVGFDSEANYSTAKDLRKLVSYAIKILPYDQIWNQQASYSFESLLGKIYKIRNSNDLVFEYKNIKSIKTGYTAKAQGNMIVEAENDKGNKVIAIVLGTPDRNDSTLEVIKYVFDNFSWN